MPPEPSISHPTTLLPEAFYLREVDRVAQDLIGCVLVREDVALRITEVEAYGGPEDSASHCRSGRTPRNAPMWEAGGRVYLFVCYGMHPMLNVVTGPQGMGSAVLIRACEPLAGLETIQARRGKAHGTALLAGPGRVARALDLDRGFNHHALFQPGGLELRPGAAPMELLAGPRIGVDYATPEDRASLRRYAAAGTRWVSHPKGLEPFHI